MSNRAWDLSVNAISLIFLAGLLYSCASEVPAATDKEEAVYHDRVVQRCIRHGDYNMADAFCAAAAKEKGQ